MTAREFFEGVAESARDAERCNRQLDELERRMHSLGGGDTCGRVSKGGASDAMARRVGAFVDMESKLKDRIEEDYETVNRACTLLYGSDQSGADGVSHAVGTLAADALWWRYCAAETWDVVSRSVGYSVRPCQRACVEAIAWIERNRYMSWIWDC